MSLLRSRRDPAKPEDVLMVEIVSQNDVGVEVLVYDYPEERGFIALKEIIKNIKKEKSSIRIGNVFPAIVLSNEEGVIVLSKKAVNEEVKDVAKEQYTTYRNLKVIGLSIFNLMKLYYEHHKKHCDVSFEDVMENTVWRVIGLFELDDENEVNNRINKLENSSKPESVNKAFYKFVLDNNDLLFDDFFEKKFSNWCSGILNEKTKRSDVEGGYDVYLESLTNLDNLKKVIEINFVDDTIRFVFVAPGHYLVTTKELTGMEVRERLDNFLEKLKEDCLKNFIKFKKGDYKTLQDSEVRFNPISEKSNLTYD